jgi:Rrf2 family transcriptional regulator, iron-sulfur cluster assembly transcription factor
MKLTTRGHYSVKALLDLVIHAQHDPVSQKAISDRQHIPQPYLEKLLIKLRQAGLIHTTRGPKGGYTLARAPRDITLGAILQAVGDQETLIEKWQPDPTLPADWVTMVLWQRLQFRLRDVLESITLEDLYFDARSYEAAQGKDSDFTV